MGSILSKRFPSKTARAIAMAHMVQREVNFQLDVKAWHCSGEKKRSKMFYMTIVVFYVAAGEPP